MPTRRPLRKYRLASVRFCATIAILLLSAAPPATAATTLTVWLTDFTAETQTLLNERIIPAFEAAHPDIDVEMQYVGWGEFDTKLITAFAAGVAPDIFQPGAEWRGQMAEQGLARPIDDLVRGWPEARDFFPGAWGSVVWKGRTYGVPYLTAPRSLVYRADLFAEAGLDPGRPPVSWEEVSDAAVKLSRIDGEGNVTRAGLLVPAADFQFWLPLLWQAGGTFVSDDGSAPLFNSPEGLIAANYYLELYQRMRGLGRLPSGGIAQGTYVMQYGNANLARQAIQGDPSLAESIWVAPPMKNEKQVAATYTDWLAISTQSQHPEEAFALIRWLVERDNLVAYNETFFFVPPRRAAVNSDYVRTNLPLNQMVERVMPFAEAYPSFNASNRFVFAEAWNKVVSQQSTPQQALNDFARGFVPITEARGAGT